MQLDALLLLELLRLLEVGQHLVQPGALLLAVPHALGGLHLALPLAAETLGHGEQGGGPTRRWRLS